jgi:NAD(P)-dependent dehydrogenase (short-subunit alcohol dehydrogenase family)
MNPTLSLSKFPSLKNKSVIVTGAARGIGRAIAQRFAQEGARVVICDINGDGATQAANDIVAAGGKAIGVQTDVADRASVDRLFERTLAEYGRLDVLVNNAALIAGVDRHVLEGDDAWFERVIGVNLNGAFFCALRACKLMAAQRDGVIINMSSGGASRAHRGMLAYDASKGGIEAMTRALALDLGPYNVRVHTLVPGSIDTAGLSDEQRKHRGENIPLARVGVPEDLAGPAVFLASDDARYMTGHCVYIDGGMLAQQRSATVDIFPLSRFPGLS